MRISDWSSDVCSSDLFPHDSPRLVESKSFKLYLNSFSEERFASTDAVSKIMKADLAQAAGASVGIELCDISHQKAREYGSLERSKESRVGKECVSTGKSSWAAYH